MDNSTTIFHSDYVDGKIYTDIKDGLPLYSNIYDEFPVYIVFSQPCRITTSNDINTEAVYVLAVSCSPNNDGTRNEWRGFIEIPKDRKDDDWSFVEDIFKEELTLDVIRWHYIGNEPPSLKTYLEHFSIGKQGSTAL